MLCSIKYSFGQFESVVLIVFTPRLLPTPGLFSVGKGGGVVEPQKAAQSPQLPTDPPQVGWRSKSEG